MRMAPAARLFPFGIRPNRLLVGPGIQVRCDDRAFATVSHSGLLFCVVRLSAAYRRFEVNPAS
jgi:hypothetical protein